MGKASKKTNRNGDQGGFKPGTPTASANPPISKQTTAEAPPAPAPEESQTPETPEAPTNTEASQAGMTDPQASATDQRPHAVIPIDPESMGGYAAGAQLTVPRGCVAVVLPVDMGGMHQHATRHIDVNALSPGQKAATRALLTAMDRQQMTLANGSRVTKPAACIRWLLEQIDQASGAQEAAKKVFEKSRKPWAVATANA